MSTRRILVVEDNLKNRKLFKDVLEYAGFEVTVAESGEQGLELARVHAPDLVLMDLQLPGIDGTQTFRLMRSLPGLEDVPVVAVTAFAMQADRDAALANGFDGFVEKPISVRALPSQVERYFDEEGTT